MKRIKRLKKKLLIFLSIGTYFITGFILCACSGCSTLQETIELRSPFYVNDQAYNANISEDTDGNVSIRLFYGERGGSCVRHLDLRTGSWDRVKSFGTPDKPVPYLEIRTNPENCKTFINSESNLKEFWNNKHQILLKQDRTRLKKIATSERDNRGRRIYKEEVIPVYPYYSNYAEFSKFYAISCNKFETAEIAWDKLPDNAIIAIIECANDEKYRYTKLYIKRYASEEWFIHDLGTPCSSMGRSSLKVCNALLLPVSIPCAFIYALITASVGIPH